MCWALWGPLLPLQQSAPVSPSCRAALELLELTLAGFDPHPMTSGCTDMKAQLPDFWGATYPPEFPCQEAIPEIIFLLSPLASPASSTPSPGCPAACP